MENFVLVAVDHSENSLRAVDYVGRMLASHPEVVVTLLTIVKEPSADIMPDVEEREIYAKKKRTESLDLLEKAGQRLVFFGIPEERIHLKAQVCSKPVAVVDLILQEHREGGHGTIVVGRRGMSKKEEFLFGSVSSKIVREASDCTVWVVE